MYEPILMSKMSFDKLNSKQQDALMKAGKVAEKVPGGDKLMEMALAVK